MSKGAFSVYGALWGGVFAAAMASAAPSVFPLKDGDVWVMVGDSITHQRLHTTYIEAFCRTRFPKWKLRFRNSGVNGDTIPRALARLDWDVAEWKPTVVSVELGMNDARGGDKSVPEYTEGMGKLVGRIRAIEARPLLLGPSPRSDGRWGRNLTLEKYTKALAGLAKSQNVPFADQISHLMPRWSKNYVPYRLSYYMAPALKSKMVPDADALQAWYDKWRKSDRWPMDLGNVVHPNHAGQLMMAYVILKELGAPPMVSAATIDVTSNKATAVTACVVSGLTCGKNAVRFRRVDERLPMPIEDRARPAFKMFPEIDDISRYVLTVRGLPAGAYAVSVDGKRVAEVTAKELAEGWNATRIARGPVADHCRRALTLIQKKVAMVAGYRSVRRSLGAAPDNKGLAELARRRKEIEAADVEVDKAVRPVAHLWEIAPAQGK